jgi:hypothetical protein
MFIKDQSAPLKKVFELYLGITMFYILYINKESLVYKHLNIKKNHIGYCKETQFSTQVTNHAAKWLFLLKIF